MRPGFGDLTRQDYTLAINISATTLNDEQFLDFVIREIDTADLRPGALCFELTEAAAMTSLAARCYTVPPPGSLICPAMPTTATAATSTTSCSATASRPDMTTGAPPCG